MIQTLFMVHGMNVGPWCWESYAKYFEEKGYQCIIPSLRFHDRGPEDDPHPELGATGLKDYVDDLEEEIRKLDSTPILMGHSMGGLLVQMLAARGCGKAAVLLTPASPHGINSLKPSVLYTFLPMMQRWGFWKKPFRHSLGKAKYSILNLLSSEEQENIHKRFGYESGRAISQLGLWLFDPRKTSAVDALKITYPILVIGCRKDKITPSTIVKKVAQKYRSVSKYKEFENNAHWVFGEPGWEKIADYTHTWLKKLGF